MYSFLRPNCLIMTFVALRLGWILADQNAVGVLKDLVLDNDILLEIWVGLIRLLASRRVKQGRVRTLGILRIRHQGDLNGGANLEPYRCQAANAIRRSK